MILVGNIGVSIKADVQFVAYSIHINLNHSGRFTNKVPLNKSNHGGKSTLFRIFAALNDLQ